MIFKGTKKKNLGVRTVGCAFGKGGIGFSSLMRKHETFERADLYFINNIKIYKK